MSPFFQFQIFFVSLEARTEAEKNYGTIQLSPDF